MIVRPLFRSIYKVLIACFLIFAGVLLLWWNEGRSDLSKIAQKSLTLQSDNSFSAEGNFVSFSGEVKSNELLGDSGLLIPGSYLKLIRKVEQYSWVETSVTRTERPSDGGSSTTITFYRYEKKWMSSPPDSSRFREKEGHENISYGLKDKEWIVRSLSIGGYRLSTDSLEVPETLPIILDSSKVVLQEKQTLYQNFLYKGEGTFDSPKIGDLRLSYSAVLLPFEGTVFGKKGGDQIIPYRSFSGETLFRLFEGGREGAIQKMREEYRVSLFFFRMQSFLLFWIGFLFLLNPLSKLIGFIPLVGKVGKFIFVLATAFSAALLTVFLTFIFSLFQSFYFLLVFFLIGILFFLFMKNSGKKPDLPLS